MIPSVVTTKTQEEENPFRGFQSRRYEAPDSFYKVENKANQSKAFSSKAISTR
jgi:hypothetical protein